MLGNMHIALKDVDSTNSHARALLRDGAGEGTVVTAEHQTAGRGRLDRQWSDETGLSFLGSYILEPVRPPEDWGGIPLMSGVAVLRALSSLVPIDLHLKWPNDVLSADKKISGILVESGQMGIRRWVVIGIGINLNQRSFTGDYRMPPTSLLLETGRMVSTEEVLAVLSKELDSLYRQWTEEGNPVILEEWKRHSRMFGQEMEMELEKGAQQRVTVVDIAPSGALVVRNPKGEQIEVFAGDIAFTRDDQGA
ncbi:MAG: biotin--[acetyl-CoA-carboxylase] ligase [Ignavibacteria bacterium]|nr:MAG: biotin--[acetyl-CoA-carboxylase] ligase [Ignavibacteria bacterium]